jgi:hypothetical protein
MTNCVDISGTGTNYLTYLYSFFSPTTHMHGQEKLLLKENDTFVAVVGNGLAGSGTKRCDL